MGGNERALPRLAWLCLAILSINALWALILPNISGRLVAVFGAVIPAAFLIAAFSTSDARRWIAEHPPSLLSRPSMMMLTLVMFLAPALFVRSPLVFAFWRVDGRTALLLAWLSVVSLSLVAERQVATNRRTVACLLSLFLLFSAGIWLTVVLDTGVASFMVSIDRRGSRPCQGDPFTQIATVWESNPASQHLYLGWRSQENFDQRIVYANHVHPYLLTMYGWIRGARYFGRLTLWAATNTSILLPVLVLIGAFGALLARSGLLWHRTGARDLLVLFLSLGILVTTWRVWIDLIRFNSDNPYPLLAGILVLLYAFLLPPMRTGAAAVTAAAFAALSPTNTPMLILPTLCLFAEGKPRWQVFLRSNRPVLIVCGAALVAGSVSYLEPRLLIKLKGFHTQESSFLFRSGLDGDTRYFTGLLQAAALPCPVNCCYARSLPDLLFPALVPLAVFGPLMVWSEGRAAAAMGRTLLFLLTPYLMSVTLFPQSVSIHPYMYDHWLVLPVVVAGLAAALSAPVERRLSGAMLLVFLLIAGGVLMSNLLGIAQGLGRAVAYFTS